ncbi:hypothetical protein ATANTOWER_000169 [Ataeniobius toweri]|uniref:Uncharacterized protein n=1 Tax=Ataeniobius toweri TaxID=208326 RepID=A0ABU7BQ90_9TELE|nr:hypothetical protein [Ataeniobius toweri]
MRLKPPAEPDIDRKPLKTESTVQAHRKHSSIMVRSHRTRILRKERPIYMLSLCRGAFRSGAMRRTRRARRAKRSESDGRVEKSELFPKFASTNQGLDVAVT